jgi:hypothetical protein
MESFAHEDVNQVWIFAQLQQSGPHLKERFRGREGATRCGIQDFHSMVLAISL